MAIRTKIHEIDREAGICVVTIMDDTVVVVDRANIGLRLDPDGSINIEYIKEVVRGQVRPARRPRLTRNPIVIDGPIRSPN